jgi:organic radical activating enzyme
VRVSGEGDVVSAEKTDMAKTVRLEIAITDYCNLRCELCSQGTPLQKNKKVLSFVDLERYGRLFAAGEIWSVKLSGGEPTLHPEFRRICEKIRELFPARHYNLATNGARLEEYIDVLGVFTQVQVSLYPGANDATVKRIQALNVPNVVCMTKYKDGELVDVNLERNLQKRQIYKHCIFTQIKKIVQDRIYPCCVIFGLALRRGWDPREMGVLLDEHWRENLSRVDIEERCRHCFMDVEAPGIDSSLQVGISRFDSTLVVRHE